MPYTIDNLENGPSVLVYSQVPKRQSAAPADPKAAAAAVPK